MFRRTESEHTQRIEMGENQVLRLRGERFEVTCLAGLIWITDGGGGDCVCEEGQQARLSSKDRICVQAFSPSSIRIRPLVPLDRADGRACERDADPWPLMGDPFIAADPR